MTYKKMQKLMDFIRKMNAGTDRKLRRLGLMAATTSRKQSRRDDQWEQTEKRIRLLLRRAKRTEGRIAVARTTSISLRNAEADRKLKRLSESGGRQISRRRKINT